MTKIKFIVSFASLAILSSCTEQQSQSAYVSPHEFKDYNCNHLAKEMAYTSSKISSATASTQSNEILGAAIVAYGISQGYGFVPSGENPALAQLKARYEALHQASILKNCD